MEFRSYNKSYSTTAVVLEQDGVSLFSETTGESSFGVLPADGATVTIQNLQGAGQTFEFDPNTDRLKYLATNTNYDEADLATLIPLLNNATPITTTNTLNEASFVFPGSSYLYLVWDLREPTAIELCYDATSIDDACCGCNTPPPTGTFQVMRCQFAFLRHFAQKNNNKLNS